MSKKPRIQRRPSPSDGIRRIVAAYVCGHCHSSSSVYRDAFGIDHLHIAHDDACPVLSGSVSDLPDTLWAAQKAGAALLIILGDDWGSGHDS